MQGKKRKSKLTDDGGVSDDLVVLNFTETVDKQSDELEILKDIRPNAKKKSNNRKSRFMDDGGVCDDLLVLNSTEIVDKQSDALQMLKEIPPNSKNKRKSTFMDDGGVSDDLVVVISTEKVDKSYDLQILKEIPHNAKKKSTNNRKSTSVDDGGVSDDELEILPNAKNKGKSTLMDDGGVSNDFMVANPAEMVDKQNDELQILREIPANAKRKRQGKKLRNKSERAGRRCCDPPSSSSTGLTPQPRLMQCGNRNWLRGDGKGYKMVVDEGSRCNRRWEDMDHEILIHIFKRYPCHIWFWRSLFICKSWLSAFLDYLFPPGQVLDLRVLDGPELSREASISLRLLKRFYLYLILNLDRRPPGSYTGIVLSEYVLRPEAYEHIARRLPLLKSFVSPEKMIPLSDIPGYILDSSERYEYIAWWMCPLMQNLERACCHITMLLTFSQCCKSIRSLTLVGIFGRCLSDQAALAIAEGFPLLERLNISGSIISVNGLSMILDRCKKNLQFLDLQHTACCRGRFCCLPPFEWPWPQEIRTKLPTVKTLLTCPGKFCTRCKHYY